MRPETNIEPEQGPFKEFYPLERFYVTSSLGREGPNVDNYPFRGAYFHSLGEDIVPLK